MNMFTRKDPAALAKQLEALKGGGSYKDGDNKEWKLTLDTAGNGSAVIRFLPGKSPDDLPFVKLVNHGFKIGNKWYIENCTSTHNDYDSCPVCKYISENDLYNTDNNMYGKLKRKTSFWANILVVKDPSNPQNEGKVFKYRFGQKIMDKINAMAIVDVEMGETPVDVFCAFEGANFIMKVKKVSGFSNYDDCRFQNTSKIPGIDKEEFQKQLIEDMVDINDMIASDKFNSFEKNDESFKRIMGTSAISSTVANAAKAADAIDDELEAFNAEMDNYTESTSKNDSDDIDDLLETI